MTKRKIRYLSDTQVFKEFILKHNLRFVIGKDDNLFIKDRKGHIINIYGYVRETHFYFNIYATDLQTYTNVDQMLEGQSKTVVQSIFLEYGSRDEVLIRELQGNEENTLKAENNFSVYTEFLNRYVIDLLSEPKQLPSNWWWPTPQTTISNLKNELKSITFDE